MTPQILLIKAVLLIRTSGPRLFRWLKKLRWKKVAIGVGIVIVLGGIIFMTRKSASVEVASVATKVVELKSVADLSALSTPLSVVGQVTSKSEATVRAEHSGQIIEVYKALGDVITAGAVAAELENASERAAVLQAEGLVEAAEANLSKITGGARSEQRSILELGVASASAGLEASKSAAVNAILSAYSSVDSAIHGTDKMFSNPGKTGSTFIILSSDSQLTNSIENMRYSVEQYLVREALVSGTLSSSSNLSEELIIVQTEVRSIRNFIDMVVSALNKGIPSSGVSETTIAAHLAEATASRTSLTSALISLSGAVQGIASSQSGLDVARKNLEQGVVGGQAEDVAAARASLKQAQGGLAAARANLEKTIIRAPISGTINSFSLKRGDYVQTSVPVLTVANNDALEVVAYVSEGDTRELAVGQKASLDQATGVVTHIAPALDPTTKKIEIRIGVNEPKNLINGQSVLVSIDRRPQIGDASKITIPISAIKVESNRVIVFAVASDNTLVAYPVVLGALLGDRVVISSGISSDLNIVTDARGLREGEKVEMK